MAQNDNHLLFDGKGTAIFCNAKGGGEVLLTYFSGNCLHANFFLSSAIVEDYERERYSYMLGFINNKEGRLYRIGGMPDHVHLFPDFDTFFNILRIFLVFSIVLRHPKFIFKERFDLLVPVCKE